MVPAHGTQADLSNSCFLQIPSSFVLCRGTVLSLKVNGLLPFLLDTVLTSSREGCCLTSSPGLSFPTCKMRVTWWLWRTAASGLSITVTKPSWTVGQEAQLKSLHHPQSTLSHHRWCEQGHKELVLSL